MALLRKLLGLPTPIDVLRADIFMEYHPLAGVGSAAVQWVPLSSDDPNLKVFLVALLYARILIVNKETRSEMFHRVDELAKQNVRDEGATGFKFQEWLLNIGLGGGSQQIWPWNLLNIAEDLVKPKVWKATLQALPTQNTLGTFGINLKMTFGLEKILAPASALLVLTSFAENTDQEGRYELAIFLWQINEFFGSPDNIQIGMETQALAAATNAVRSGNLQLP